jgi:hypothetical protein
MFCIRQLPLLQIIVLVALARTIETDDQPNFEMAYREMQQNWRSNPTIDRSLFFNISS